MEWFKRLIHKYDDYKECGEWGVFDVNTDESIVKGKLYHRTIKVEKDDGSIGLDYEWITDEEMKDEKNEN